MANCVDPDEMAHYEPSHLDLHCLQRYLPRSAGMKGLRLHVFYYCYSLPGFIKTESSYKSYIDKVCCPVIELGMVLCELRSA